MANRKNIRKLKREIKKCIVDGIRRNGDRIFATSQLEVPVKTGYLKNSALPGAKKVRNGMKITYRAKYASRIHKGSRWEPITGEYTYKFKRHKRTYPYIIKHGKGKGKNWTWVVKHEKRYKDKVIIPIDAQNGIWRVSSHWPYRQPNPFLYRAACKEIKYLKKDIGFYLERLGKVIVR